MKQQSVKKLASVLLAIGTDGEKLETRASLLLAFVKDNDVRTLDDLNAAVIAAYGMNGWNTRQGRPTAERRDKVPTSVRTYVWELRSAMRDGLPLWTYKTFYELRLARGKLRQKNAAAPVIASNPLPDLPELTGVRVSSVDAPNGHLFHDLLLTFATIPDAQRMLLARNLERLLAKYQAVPAEKKRATG